MTEGPHCQFCLFSCCVSPSQDRSKTGVWRRACVRVCVRERGRERWGWRVLASSPLIKLRAWAARGEGVIMGPVVLKESQATEEGLRPSIFCFPSLWSCLHPANFQRSYELLNWLECKISNFNTLWTENIGWKIYTCRYGGQRQSRWVVDVVNCF